MKRLRLAQFTPYLPAPAHSGGRIRILELTRALTEFADVSLFAAVDPRDRQQFAASPELSIYRQVTLAHHPLAFVPTARPERVRRAAAPALARAFREAHARQPFDLALVEHSHAAGIALSAGLPCVLDEHNVESRYLEQRLRAKGRADSWLGRRQVAALERWEQALWRRAEAISCVSREDAEQIARFHPREAVVIPNGVALARVPFSQPSARSGYEILFVGVMGHPPNAQAARWLIERVMPLVWQREARARLCVCGADPPAELRGLAGDRVEVTGRVEAIAPFLARAAVYANPLREGAGTSLKVLEALASGLPLVSTAIGVRGFALRAPADYLHAEDEQSFAEHLLACLQHRDRRDAAARSGRRLAEAHDWPALAARFAELVRATASRHCAARP